MVGWPSPPPTMATADQAPVSRTSTMYGPMTRWHAVLDEHR